MDEIQRPSREIFLDWHQRMRCFGNTNKRGREEFLHEMEENMPARLSEIKQYLQNFLEEGSDFTNTYNVLLRAHDLTIALESASTLKGIDVDQLHRLKILEKEIKALHVFECRKSVNVVEFLRRWSSKLEKWTSHNGSEDELLAILKTFEDWSETAFIWPNILGNIRDLHECFEQERWQAHLLDVFTYIVKGVQMFKTRLEEACAQILLEEARDAPDLDHIPLVDRLHEMIAALRDILENDIVSEELVIVNVTVDPVMKPDETTPLEGTEHIESGRYCLTKRPLEHVNDLLIRRSVFINTLDLSGEAEELIVREMDEKVNIKIFHQAPETYTLYHMYLMEGAIWTRHSTTRQNDQLSSPAKLPQQTTVFFTSMENNTNPTLCPEKEYLHVCPENNDAMVEFPKGAVMSSKQINITLSECKFPQSEIIGYSDIICIKHDDLFLKPVSITLPVTLIIDGDITTCDLFCVLIEEEGITIKEDMEVEILSGNLCRFSTNTSGRHVLHAKRKAQKLQKRSLETFAKQLTQIYTSTPHNILLFLGGGFGEDIWKLHAEVVQQAEVKQTVEKRRTEMFLMELPQCRSPSLVVRGINHIDVVADSNGSLSMLTGTDRDHVTLNIIQGGEDNFIGVPIKRTRRDLLGIVHFRVTGTDLILHKAFLSQGDMDRFSHLAKLQVDADTITHSYMSHPTNTDTATPVPLGVENDFVLVTKDPVMRVPPLTDRESGDETV